MLIALTVACYLAFGWYIAEAFRRDVIRNIDYDDTDERPPGTIGLLGLIILWAPCVAAALFVSAYRVVRGRR